MGRSAGGPSQGGPADLTAARVVCAHGVRARGGQNQLGRGRRALPTRQTGPGAPQAVSQSHAPRPEQRAAHDSQGHSDTQTGCPRPAFPGDAAPGSTKA